MKVALIQCPGWGRDCPPYTLAFLKALLTQYGHEVYLFDLNNAMYHGSKSEYRKVWDDKDYYSFWENSSLIEQLVSENRGLWEEFVEKILKTRAEVVGFTTHTTSFLISLRLAESLKQADSKRIIVFGGPQCSRSQAAYSLIKEPVVDYVCTGEGDVAFPELLNKLSKGKVARSPGFLLKEDGRVVDCGDPPLIEDLDSLPFPDYSDFAPGIREGLYRQPERLEIFDSRGCITHCHFCSEWQFWKRFRSMSGRRVYDEVCYQIKKFPRADYFYFNGSLINGNLNTLKEFSELLIENEVKIRWAGQALARSGMTKELLRKMRKSGCVWLGYGIESGSQRVLDKMNKRYSISKAERVLKDTHEAGIEIQANFMFGLPTETEEDFGKTLEFLARARPCIDTILASQSFCVLDKGTYLHCHPAEFGITSKNHHLFWKSNNGKNNYAERFRRYERFCALALRLGIPETSGVLAAKPDKWFLLGEYYQHEGEYDKAIESFQRSLERESENKTTYCLLSECYQGLGRHRKEMECLRKALVLKSKDFSGQVDDEIREKIVSLERRLKE